MRLVAGPLAALSLLAACSNDPSRLADQASSPMDSLLAQYDTFTLTTDLARLTDAEQQMLPLLIDAAKEMDAIFWEQAAGPRDSVLGSIGDSATRRYADINYGPWDRLDGNAPFVAGVGPKPEGARFYPADITKAEFDSAAAGTNGDDLKHLYTMVRRDRNGGLISVPYHEAFMERTERAVAKIREAAALAPQESLKRYLELRADALLTDDYRASDLAWMDMRDNILEVVIGPIETYEDALYGQKAAHTAYILVKDTDWSQRLARYAELLPSLQRGLPVPERYKRESPGTDADLNAYDALYYAGQSNAGSKTIAINLPNDETVQLEKGTRRLQLKNSMRAKFDKIMVPIATQLVAEDQRANVTFDAFFANTMFHEVAHGLGIKNTLNGSGTVREALKEEAGALEEGKADVLGLYMITALAKSGEEPDARVEDNLVTFMAGIFRSVRFGAASAHGRANVARFNYFMEQGAFTRDSVTRTYRADLEKMLAATDSLSAKILTLQGDGDYAGVQAFMQKYGSISPELQSDLDRLAAAGIPVDVTFRQGMEVLGVGE